MYTFMVGPWLPTKSSTISEGLVHTPGTEEDRNQLRGRQSPADQTVLSRYLRIRLTHWLPLCHLLHSSKPRRSPPSLCNCGLKRLSAGRQANAFEVSLLKNMTISRSSTKSHKLLVCCCVCFVWPLGGSIHTSIRTDTNTNLFKCASMKAQTCHINNNCELPVLQ